MPRTRNHKAQERLAELIAELRSFRRWRGDMPQTTLSERLHVTTNSVADWEAGRDSPSARHFVMWSHELGLRAAVTDTNGIEVPVGDNTSPGNDEPYPHPQLRELAATLRAVRIQRQLNQTALSTTLGCSQRSITRWETANGYPPPITLIQWAHALECELMLLLAQTITFPSVVHGAPQVPHQQD